MKYLVTPSEPGPLQDCIIDFGCEDFCGSKQCGDCDSLCVQCDGQCTGNDLCGGHAVFDLIV